LFRRLKVGLYAPVRAPAHQYVPGSGDGSANKSKFWSTEDWMRPLRSIKKLGIGRFDELVVEVEYYMDYGADGPEEVKHKLLQALQVTN
jgi:hypothetical protein